ncbi:MAG TPA: glycosyltransferase, partial [Acidimicrobiales bacterium]
RDELDQEQHDAVRDVFVVPGACTLVRADLFDHLGGYDPGIRLLGEDLDLCWRAHVAGARVLIAPQVRVRHLEALGSRHEVDDRRRLLARHRLRTMRVCYRPLTRLLVLPQAFLLAVVESLYAVLLGRAGQAGDLLGAYVWNWRRSGAIRSRRKELAAVRTVADREIRELQVSGSARLSAYVRGQIGASEDRLSSWSRSGRNLAGTLNRQRRRGTTVFVAVLLVLVAFSTRDLVTGRIPAVGEMAAFPSSPMVFLRAWASGWRSAGLGSTAPQPTGYGIFGLLGVLFFGATGVLRQVLIVGMLPLGLLGAWRLARPIGSRRATVVAFAVYIAIPVPYNALARGSWSGLLLYAASPWMLLLLARSSRMAPYGARGVKSDADEVVGVDRALLGQILGLGLLLAAVSTVVPFALGVVLLCAVALTVGSLICFRFGGVVRMLVAAVGACVVAAVLQLPWSLDLIRPSSQWAAFAGIRTSLNGPLSLGKVMRFQTGPFGAPPLGWAFLVAAALPVIIGRSWRLEWAIRAWFLALAGWGLVWAGQRGWLPLGLPSSEILLAPVAAALALAAA